MGADKAAVRIDEQLLLDLAVGSLVAAAGQPFAEILLAVGSREGPPRSLGWPHRRVFDCRRDAGPLAGLLAGLEAARTPWTLATACDRPEAQPELVRALLERRLQGAGYQAIVPASSRGPEPLLALYHRSLAPLMRAFLEDGRRGVVDFLGDVRMLCVPFSEMKHLDPTERSFLNLNTPGELEAYRRSRGADPGHRA